MASEDKRRTTLTLPADLLKQAERMASARKVDLSTVISEWLAEAFRPHAAVDRSEQVLSAYRAAFSGSSEDDLAILKGVILEPVPGQ